MGVKVNDGVCVGGKGAVSVGIKVSVGVGIGVIVNVWVGDEVRVAEGVTVSVSVVVFVNVMVRDGVLEGIVVCVGKSTVRDGVKDGNGVAIIGTIDGSVFVGGLVIVGVEEVRFRVLTVIIPAQ